MSRLATKKNIPKEHQETVSKLSELFPKVTADVIYQVFEESGHNMERTTNNLLANSSGWSQRRAKSSKKKNKKNTNGGYKKVYNDSKKGSFQKHPEQGKYNRTQQTWEKKSYQEKKNYKESQNNQKADLNQSSQQKSKNKKQNQVPIRSNPVKGKRKVVNLNSPSNKGVNPKLPVDSVWNRNLIKTNQQPKANKSAKKKNQAAKKKNENKQVTSNVEESKKSKNIETETKQKQKQKQGQE
eukprot:Anaeramoba_flamelloidesa1053524_57.p1 GENE.a1053524_57~~a1053524_57.p1  ORF type:complete len:240 (-),score=68.95 a1053524_57:65-784(-)